MDTRTVSLTTETSAESIGHRTDAERGTWAQGARRKAQGARIHCLLPVVELERS